jgi:AcrR family transcriptional regulator
MSDSEKQAIVEAARQRFSHYSYGKTTMAEIASDCGMSVGNLYRFYKNKEDIAVEGSRACLADKAENAELAAASAESAMDGLHAYFLARLRYLHDFVSNTPHMQELVQLISGKHMDVLQHFESRAIESIRSVVQSGIDSGEFRDCDAAGIAADLYHATNKYNMPMCVVASLDVLEDELSSLLELIYLGLKS